MKIKILLICTFIASISFVSAAHYIVGNVNDALNGEPANGKIVTLWNPSNGLSDNLTDIVGPEGNSNTDNTYFIDCEMLQSPCQIGDTISVQIFNNGSNYVSNQKNVTITGAGYDVAENLSLNSPPKLSSLQIEDDIIFPTNEIDLTPATTKQVICSGIINDLDNETEIKNATAVLFNVQNSNYLDLDDNNYHYTNQSCLINLSYGTNKEAEAICMFNIWYYANAGNWNCTINAFDNLSTKGQGSNITQVNTLLALEVISPIDYGTSGVEEISSEMEVNVTNYGNVKINLSLSGYAVLPGDEKAMNCSLKGDIPIYYEKYNLTTPNPGNLNLIEFEKKYTNLTSTPKIETFNLEPRQNDFQNEAIGKTYWRIYLPKGNAGSCSGNILFGAVQGQST